METVNKKSSTEVVENRIDNHRRIGKSKITDLNTYLFHEGRNYEAYKFMGSHFTTENNIAGVRFTVWAPKAKKIWVIGDFTNFKLKEKNRMIKVTNAGIWSVFIPKLKEGDRYKYAIEDSKGKVELKADPYAIESEKRPLSASILYRYKRYKWNDLVWRNFMKDYDPYVSPMNIYEVHLGSWKKNGEEFYSYEELSEKLPEYVREMGYTHIEILPIIEHPLDASWGYQGVGYYSATSRYGNREGLKQFIDKCHQNRIGVILDWVPGHFCKDGHGLIKFDGTPTYEYEEEWKGENKGWGTLNFNLGKPEVKSFLISNALYWIREFHVDGLRVDAVSNIIYLNYGRNSGEWRRNKYGGNGNLEGIEFIKEMNKTIRKEFPTVVVIAEEATSWPNVCGDVEVGALGFHFKWNMGWMNDTLEYVKLDPIHRKFHHNNLTFAMMYNHTEKFILPISHDEVVHGKKSLVDKMWGDYWNKFAGLRLFQAYMMGHPGKKLNYMGNEIAQFIEWREYEEIEWKLIEDFEMHERFSEYIKVLNNLYLNESALWELDNSFAGFQWIEPNNHNQSVLIFRRMNKDKENIIFVMNFTPVVYYDYRIGIPDWGIYKELLNSDSIRFGGSGQTLEGVNLVSEEIPFHNQPYSLKLKIPPMGAIILKVCKEEIF